MRRQQYDLAESFSDDNHLQQFILTHVTPTGKILGTGSVEEVRIFTDSFPFMNCLLYLGTVSEYGVCWQENS